MDSRQQLGFFSGRSSVVCGHTPRMHMIRKHALKFIVAGLIFLLAGVIWAGSSAFAMQAEKPVVQGSPLHPTFPFLDENGDNVLDSGFPVSTMNTCGACHDAEFIVSHSFHADVGLKDFGIPGQANSGRSWDTSPGLFGKWNSINYRLLSPEGDARIDLGTADWLRTVGIRHVGGGPATTSRDGNPLQSLSHTPHNPQTNILDSETGKLIPWNFPQANRTAPACRGMRRPRSGRRCSGGTGLTSQTALRPAGPVFRPANLWTAAEDDAGGQFRFQAPGSV